ncbi:hypothetical protein BDW02DRAFT_645742 [Decorospora gaudefroyi]|uniref:Uncharacterized protein n=1 Tax=Decorospora gaudefroyi TaxID=184978 RepID=A0A6A5KM38_9PLEO|nr:hypothetical protein BDW02DRAFT_645742 [Decorospora gaudefroyi]
MENSQAADSLRIILAKSSRQASKRAPPQSAGDRGDSVPSMPTAGTSTSSVPLPIRSAPILEYPSVNVPGSSPQLATGVTPSNSSKFIFGKIFLPSSKSSSRTRAGSSAAKSYGGSFFKSFRGRSAWDYDEDEFGDRKYTTATLKKKQPAVASEVAKPPPEPSSSTPHPAIGSSPNVPSGLASGKQTRTLSWVDQRTNETTIPTSLSSDIKGGGEGEQATSGEADTNSKCTSSTLSLDSLISSSNSVLAPTSAPRLPPATAKESTLATARALSPFKGRPLWEPDDEEWAQVDATALVSTFKASFKDPAHYPPQQEASTLSKFESTITSFLSSHRTPNTTQLQAEAEEEEIRDKIEMLQNTYFCNPAGDISDEVMAQVFLPGSRFFPCAPTPSPRSMHIVDLDAYFSTSDPLLRLARPRLCDAVATLLSHTNAECVASFLCPSVGEFVYRRELDRNKAGTVVVVRRQGNTVFAGIYRSQGFRLQWSLYIKSHVSITGHWHEAYAALKPGSTPIINGIPAWDQFEPDDKFPSALAPQLPHVSAPLPHRKIALASPKKNVLEHGNGDENEEVGPRDPKLMLYQSRLLAQYLLRDIWVRFDGLCECRATWEADGEVNNVRLKRAVVGFGEDEEG